MNLNSYIIATDVFSHWYQPAIPKVRYSEGPLFRRLEFGWVGHEGSDPVGLYHIAVFPRTYSLTQPNPLCTLAVIQTPTLTQI